MRQYGKRGLLYGKRGLLYGKRGLVHGKRGLLYGKRGLLYGKRGLPHGKRGLVALGCVTACVLVAPWQVKQDHPRLQRLHLHLLSRGAWVSLPMPPW